MNCHWWKHQSMYTPNSPLPSHRCKKQYLNGSEWNQTQLQDYFFLINRCIFVFSILIKNYCLPKKKLWMVSIIFPIIVFSLVSNSYLMSYTFLSYDLNVLAPIINNSRYKKISKCCMLLQIIFCSTFQDKKSLLGTLFVTSWFPTLLRSKKKHKKAESCKICLS